MPALLASCACLYALGSVGAAAAVVREDPIQLKLHPRVCTLAAQDEHCDTVVQAQWQSPRDESLCLVIVGRPQIKRCWENYSAGFYTVELVFSENLIVELRDPQLQRVLVSQTITVIREALNLRRKRRQPWNIL
jgi:hypothetical protein